MYKLNKIEQEKQQGLDKLMLFYPSFKMISQVKN